MLNREVIITAVVSSIIVLVFSLILFFIIGCVCGWYGHKYKTKQSDKTTHSQAAPLYEDLQPPMSMLGNREKMAFELKENIAYGPVQST